MTSDPVGPAQPRAQTHDLPTERSPQHPAALAALPPKTECLSADQGDAYHSQRHQLRKRFLQEAPGALASARQQLKGFLRTGAGPLARTCLSELSARFGLLGDHAALAGFHRMAHMTRALAKLLRSVEDHPRGINPSIARTITRTVDFLSPLLEATKAADVAPFRPPLILVVDDETALLSVVCAALHQADLAAIGVDDPHAALRLLRLNPVDLVFLDIAMPAMDGFTLCTQLRAIPLHKQTPVVFLTGLDDFEHRARSVLQGGNDLVAKPFLPAELIVKALTYIFQSQLGTVNEPAA